MIESYWLSNLWVLLFCFLDRVTWFYVSLGRCWISFDFWNSRRPGTHDCLSWPTKPRQHGGENVPADSDFLSWAVANPRTTLPTSTIWAYENLAATDWVRTKDFFFIFFRFAFHLFFHFFIILRSSEMMIFVFFSFSDCVKLWFSFFSFSDHVKLSFLFVFHSPIVWNYDCRFFSFSDHVKLSFSFSSISDHV